MLENRNNGAEEASFRHIFRAKIAKNALKNNTSLKYEALKTGLINEKNYEKIVDPKKMIYPK